MALARAGKIAPLPIPERPLAEAQAALDDLRAGRVVGRVVLVDITSNGLLPEIVVRRVAYF